MQLPSARNSAAPAEPATIVAALFDAVFAVLIVAAGILAWSPSTGVAAARETIMARRRRRSRIAEIEDSGGAVWRRHLRRQPLHQFRL